jgi:hypothetical protein
MTLNNAFGAIALDATLTARLPKNQSRIRYGFARVVASGPDTTVMASKILGSGMTVAQTGGNLVIGSGTTVRSETILRSLTSFTGPITMRFHEILSQRIVNQSFIVELVDVLGDGLAYSIGSATAITVTFPAGHGFTTADNAGQSINLGAFVGTGTFLSGNYPIASVSGNDITFTVAGFAVGTGTVSAFGWNYTHVLYDSTTATSTKFGVQNTGWPQADVVATINTSASPGQLSIVTNEEPVAGFQDQLLASSNIAQTAFRAAANRGVPGNATPLFLQIRVLNGTTAPASTTTWTLGFVDIENFQAQQVSIVSSRPQSLNAPLPVIVSNTNIIGVDTELPNAAALADGAANPTSPAVGGFDLVWNGATWDRVRNNLNTTTGDTGAKTATFNGATQTNFNARGAIITVLCATVSGTSPTMNVQLQWSPDAGTTWLAYGPVTGNVTATGNTATLLVYPTHFDDASSTTATALAFGATVSKALNAPLPRTWRLVYTIGGTTPSFTITAVYVNYIN